MTEPTPGTSAEYFPPEDTEWHPYVGHDGTPTGWVFCRHCAGTGKFNKDGKPSKKSPPRHIYPCFALDRVGRK